MGAATASRERPSSAVDRFTTFAIALLAATALTATPVWAAGGEGGGGVAGGADQASGTGGAGVANPSGGGGGGAGVIGGAGGNGSSPGGEGGAAPGGAGQPGLGGSGGGGGGAHGQAISLSSQTLVQATGGAGGNGGNDTTGGGGGAGGWGASITVGGSFANTAGSSVTGGVGGAGGTSSGGNGGGGGSGGLGVGVDIGAPVSLTNSGTIAGGIGAAAASVGDRVGGMGGSGVAFFQGDGHTFVNGPGATVTGAVGGASGSNYTGLGASGGFGVAFQGSNATVFNDVGATIAGGNGGASGIGGNGGPGGIAISIGGADSTVTNLGTIRGGDAAPGGTGIINSVAIAGFAGLTVINSGSIIGGLQADGVTRVAITFAGGSNVLELQAGSTITGEVRAFSATDTLRLGGSVNQSFDVTALGPTNQYRDFGVFSKTGTGTATLTGTTTEVTPWTISGGTLAISQAGSLGDVSGAVTLNGGTLRALATFGVSRAMTLNGGGGTIDTNGNGMTVSGAISGSGGLTKTGGGTLTLTAANGYTGATTINAGTLALVGAGALTDANSVTVAGTATFDITGITGPATGIGTLAGSGTVQIGGKGLVLSNASTEFSGVIAGPGGDLQVDLGTLTLSGASTYSGLTFINEGATVALKGAGSIANSGVVVTSGVGPGQLATFDISQTDSGAIVAGLFDSPPGGRVSLGSRTLTLTANTAFGGVIQDGGIGGGTGGGLTIANGLIVELGGINTYTGATTVAANSVLALSGPTADISASSGLFLAGVGATFDISCCGGGRTLKDLSGVAGTSIVLGANSLTVGTANSTSFAGVIDGTGGLIKVGTGTLTLSGNNLYSGGTTINAGTLSISADSNLGGAAGPLALNGGTLQITGANVNSARAVTLGAGGGTFDIGQNANLLGTIGGAGGLTKTGPGTLALGGSNNYGGGTTINAGLVELLPGASLGPGPLAINGGTFNNGGNNVSVGGLSGSGGLVLNGGSLAANSVANDTFSGVISGSGALVKQGTGTLTLTGNNTYSGGTTVSGGILAGTTSSLQGNILNNATVSFNQASNGTYAGAMSGTGGVTLQGGGVLSITGNNLYTGPTTVTGSGLVVNGSLASTVTLDANSAIGGTGTIGALVSNGAMLAPGNSIGTLTVSGNFSQNGGTYVVEANGQGQSDRINAGGTATINGGTVQLVAASGSYANSTTYTIVNATGGVSGTYSGVTSNFAFLTPTLSYNANNVFLTLALQGAAFSGFGGNTVNQRAVGYALDQSYANATGDFATVIGALAGLNTAQGPLALNTISGQPYADFGTMNMANASLFMNTLAQQMANARAGSAPGARVALAQACEVEACDEARPLSAWFSGLGGLGSVQGDGNSSTLTYNVGGAAAGLDYRFDPRFLVGLGAGYTHGTQWVNSFMGQGWSDSVSVAAYGSFTPSGSLAGFYADALVGYAYLNNQLQRQIQIPGLQQRTASGSTGANQFLAQVETGYKLGVWTMGALTPFARFQTSITTQNAFTESGANSLNLAVAQQTTNSVRSVLGAEFASSTPLGSERALGLSLRLGWQHEYAYTGRPITASFGGAPTASFTVYGATPTRDAAIVGFSATTSVATATQLYLRYDGELASGTDNHALTAGLRLSW